MNTNIGFYVECRHKLGKTIDEIFSECKSAFKRFDPNRFDPNKFMLKKKETRNRPIEYKFGEKIEFINFKFSSLNFVCSRQLCRHEYQLKIEQAFIALSSQKCFFI